jgi:hypothetical protein
MPRPESFDNAAFQNGDEDIMSPAVCWENGRLLSSVRKSNSAAQVRMLVCFSLYANMCAILCIVAFNLCVFHEQASHNATSSICPETGAILEGTVSRDRFTQKLTVLFEILYSTSSSNERAVIIGRAFDGTDRLSHLDRMARQVALEIDSMMAKVEANLQEQEQVLQHRLDQLETLPAYKEMQRVCRDSLADGCATCAVALQCRV